jgi:5-formyltetrahydrofolate cyclo-ligase
MSAAAQKQALRARMKAALREMSAADRAAASQRILAKLAAHEAFNAARVVMIFAALPSEPDLLPLLERCGEKKAFIFPKIVPNEPRRLILRQASNLAEFETNGLLREPAANCPEIPLESVDLILVPGLAFDPATMARMGRGGGFYDTLLADPRRRARAVGVCFRCQLVSPLTTEPHDVLMQEILTD